MLRSAATATMPTSGKLKVLLLVVAFGLAAGTLWYTASIVQALQQREQVIADLYAKSLEYVASAHVGEGDYGFIFSEVIHTIDFPILITDARNEPIAPYADNSKNIDLNREWTQPRQRERIIALMEEMDRRHPPIRVAYQDTVILSYVHFGDSELVTRLRWLPYVEFAVISIFILIGYISFSYVKRSEQSSIWVGMARETAHQLGTPISSMLGWVELLKEQGAAEGHAQETLKDMEHDLHRLQKIADRFSKIGSKPDLREENLREVVENVVGYFQRRIPRTGKRVELSVEPGEPVPARVSRELFEWVIENLTKNALDAIETGEGRIAYSLSAHDHEAVVTVSDTGKGIDPRFRKEVFRPGYSTKKRGWGLGLSLAQRIIESYHRGRLDVNEAPEGFRTSFRIRIPQ
jgi:signal transduction histidine kinase